jgi:hypothetical protein
MKNNNTNYLQLQWKIQHKLQLQQKIQYNLQLQKKYYTIYNYNEKYNTIYNYNQIKKYNTIYNYNQIQKYNTNYNYNQIQKYNTNYNNNYYQFQRNIQRKIWARRLTFSGGKKSQIVNKAFSRSKVDFNGDFLAGKKDCKRLANEKSAMNIK